jgi:hypothetical protein
MKLFGTSVSAGSFAIGAGAVILAPVVLPIVGAVLRPLAKSVIKGSLIAFESAKVSMAESREMLDDLAAEAKSELAEKGRAE